MEDLGTGCSDADTQGSCTRGASGCCAEVSCRELLGGLCLREPWRTKLGPAHKGKDLWAKRLRPKTVRGGPACVSRSWVPPASWSLPLIPWFKKDWTPWLTTYHPAQRTRGKRPFVPSRSAHSTKKIFKKCKKMNRQWETTAQPLKPILNWANVCSPEHTSDTSTNYDSFLNWTFSSPNMVRTVQTLLHSQLACNEMQASAQTCSRRTADSMIENVG